MNQGKNSRKELKERTQGIRSYVFIFFPTVLLKIKAEIATVSELNTNTHKSCNHSCSQRWSLKITGTLTNVITKSTQKNRAYFKISDHTIFVEQPGGKKTNTGSDNAWLP